MECAHLSQHFYFGLSTDGRLNLAAFLSSPLSTSRPPSLAPPSLSSGDEEDQLDPDIDIKWMPSPSPIHRRLQASRLGEPMAMITLLAADIGPHLR